MLYELILLSQKEDSSPELILDDFSSGSQAIYVLKNPNCYKIIYFCPDEFRGLDAQCDYLLYIPNAKSVKFVELKGVDSDNSGHQCCRTSWQHGFHQLEATYDKYSTLLDIGETTHFVLSTSLPRTRITSRYKNYTRYRKLMELSNGNVSILCDEECDESLSV